MCKNSKWTNINAYSLKPIKLASDLFAILGWQLQLQSEMKSIIWYPTRFGPSIRISDWRSNLMWLYSPVDLTGNVNMIEKLIFGGTGNRGPPNPRPNALTSAPSRHSTSIYPWAVYFEGPTFFIWTGPGRWEEERKTGREKMSFLIIVFAYNLVLNHFFANIVKTTA